jgi:hypothetical protein
MTHYTLRSVVLSLLLFVRGGASSAGVRRRTFHWPFLRGGNENEIATASANESVVFIAKRIVWRADNTDYCANSIVAMSTDWDTQLWQWTTMTYCGIRNMKLSPDNTTLFASSNTQWVLSLNAATGSLNWEYALTSVTLLQNRATNPAVQLSPFAFSQDGSILYFTAATGGTTVWISCPYGEVPNVGAVVALSTATGAVVWRYNSVWNYQADSANFQSGQISAPLANHTMVYVGFQGTASVQSDGCNIPASTSKMFAFNAASGVLVWKFTIPAGNGGWFGTCAPISSSSSPLNIVMPVTRGVVVINTSPWFVDGSPPAVAWIYASSSLPSDCVQNDFPLFQNQGTTITSISWDTGAQSWSRNFSAGLSSSFMSRRGSALVGLSGTTYFGLDSLSGSTLWSYNLMDTVLAWNGIKWFPQGPIVFTGWSGDSRLHVVDLCPAGYECSVPGVPRLCPTGQYSSAGLTTCLWCPPESYAANGVSCLPISPASAANLIGCFLRDFSAHDVVGSVMRIATAANVSDCKSLCCANSTCVGYSFFTLPFLAQPPCMLLSNVSSIVPSNFASGGVNASLLGFTS